MKLTEFEIIDVFTEEKEDEFREFIQKNLEKTEVIGVECVMNFVDLIGGLHIFHDITSILTNMAVEREIRFILVMGEEIDVIDNKIKIKLFDAKPNIQAEFN